MPKRIALMCEVTLALVGLLALIGCAHQRVWFQEPAGARLVVDGRPRGEVPLMMDLRLGSHEVELRFTDEVLRRYGATTEEIQEARSYQLCQIRGVLLVLNRTDILPEFLLSPELVVNVITENQLATCWWDDHLRHRVLFFKGSTQGIQQSDPDVTTLLRRERTTR